MLYPPELRGQKYFSITYEVFLLRVFDPVAKIVVTPSQTALGAAPRYADNL